MLMAVAYLVQWETFFVGLNVLSQKSEHKAPEVNNPFYSTTVIPEKPLPLLSSSECWEIRRPADIKDCKPQKIRA